MEISTKCLHINWENDPTEYAHLYLLQEDLRLHVNGYEFPEDNIIKMNVLLIEVKNRAPVASERVKGFAYLVNPYDNEPIAYVEL